MGRAGKVALVACAALVSACGLVVSFSDYETGQARFAIKGTVDGLEDQKVALVVNGRNLEVGNGPFEIRDVVADLNAYSVSVPVNPPGHVCTVDNASARVSGQDVTDVAVHCLPTDDGLASLVVEGAGALSPAFTPEQATYTAGAVRLSLFDGKTRSVTVKATAKSKSARVSVAGTEQAQATVPLKVGANPIAVTVTAAAPGSAPRTTTVSVVGTIEDYLKPSNPRVGTSFGTSTAVSGSTLVVGAPFESSSATGVNGDELSKGGTGSGAAYIFTWNGTAWSQEAYLKASINVLSAQFGNAVAVAGDTVAVAAFVESAVYVFRRTGTTWAQEARLTPAAPSTNGYFGASLALEGSTLVVGESGTGKVHVFQRTGTTWNTQTVTMTSTLQANAQFGNSVAISGTTIAVGAPGLPPNTTPAGAAYLFVWNGTEWAEQDVVTTTLPSAYAAQFGYSVALSGDTLAVGAEFERSNATGVGGNEADASLVDAGAAYVFTRSGTKWSRQAYLKPFATRAGQQFGYSVALAGDVLAVGSMWESGGATLIDGDVNDVSASNAGAVYLFARTGTTWARRAYVKPRVKQPEGYFGCSVAFDGKFLAVGQQGSSNPTKGVGADPADTSMFLSNAGAAWVYY